MSEFLECVENIDNLLNILNIRNILGGKIDIIKNAKNIIFNDINLAQEDKQPEITDQNVKVVTESLNILYNIFIDSPVSNEFLKLMQEFSLLAFNWSNELAKQQEIIRLAKTVDRFANYHMTSIEMLDLTKKMLSRMRSMSNYSIPGVELSKHYLESIDNKLRKNNEQLD